MILYTNQKDEKRICFYNSDKYSTDEIQNLLETKKSLDSPEVIDISFDSMKFLGEIFECIASNAPLSKADKADDTNPLEFNFTDDKYVN